jgi:Raf kinase inhibitor-like YbhB/YbcL family protein
MNHISSVLRVGIVAAATLAFNFASAADFKLSSPELQPLKSIPASHYWNNFGCSGDNVAPKLEWHNPPAGTKSFAITFYDLDAPTGSGFWHWVAYDIPVNVSTLEGGKDGGPLPVGVQQSNTDLSKPGFFGPCPPIGRKHRYQWTIHALKVEKLPVEPGMSPALVGFFIGQNRLGQAQLTVTAGPRK